MSSDQTDRYFADTGRIGTGAMLLHGHKQKENAMFILQGISRLATEYSRVRSRYLTERSVRALPLEIQKDIGWPDLQTSRPSARGK